MKACRPKLGNVAVLQTFHINSAFVSNQSGVGGETEVVSTFPNRHIRIGQVATNPYDRGPLAGHTGL